MTRVQNEIISIKIPEVKTNAEKEEILQEWSDYQSEKNEFKGVPFDTKEDHLIEDLDGIRPSRVQQLSFSNRSPRNFVNSKCVCCVLTSHKYNTGTFLTANYLSIFKISVDYNPNQPSVDGIGRKIDYVWFKGRKFYCLISLENAVRRFSSFSKKFVEHSSDKGYFLRLYKLGLGCQTRKASDIPNILSNHLRSIRPDLLEFVSVGKYTNCPRLKSIMEKLVCFSLFGRRVAYINYWNTPKLIVDFYFDKMERLEFEDGKLPKLSGGSYLPSGKFPVVPKFSKLMKPPELISRMTPLLPVGDSISDLRLFYSRLAKRKLGLSYWRLGGSIAYDRSPALQQIQNPESNLWCSYAKWMGKKKIKKEIDANKSRQVSSGC